MINRAYMRIAVLALAVGPLFATASTAAEGVARGEQLAETFRALNERLNRHVDGIKACIGEMDRFESGEFQLQPEACRRYNRIYTDGLALAERAERTLAAYRTWSERTDIPEPRDPAIGVRNATALLLRIYDVKLKQAREQTRRVRDLRRILMEDTLARRGQ